MYTIQFGEGAPLSLPNKKALKVAVKLYNMLRGEYTKQPPRGDGAPGIYGVSIGFYPYFPKITKSPPRGYMRLFECYTNTPFLTLALRGYELNAKPPRAGKGSALITLTPEEEALAYKLFAHPLEDELRREIAVHEARGKNIYDLYDNARGLEPYDDIPLLLWNSSNTTILSKKERGEDFPIERTPYYELYGDRKPEDVVKELLAKINKK